LKEKYTKGVFMDFNFKKKFGQNFLTDKNLLNSIVELSGADENSVVLEIGPGAGALTQAIAKKVKKVISFEIDKTLEPILAENLKDFDNSAIVFKDFMKVSNEEIIDIVGKDFIVIANLPYYITTPIIMSLLEMELPKLEKMVFMVQKEVGQRMTAKPGGKDYGALSVTVKYFSESSIAFIVPPHCFIPQPGVDSCVVKLDVRKEAPFELKDRDYFFKVVKASFSQRRKMLTNSLANAGYLGVDRQKVLEALEVMGKDEKIRGETLSPEEFGRLADLLCKKFEN
jgi:16S rRNA (adenine1518-N6/adenine1519-N6)-dimethyltransferase